MRNSSLLKSTIMLKDLFSLLNEVTEHYSSLQEAAEREGNTAKVEYYQGAIDAIQFVKRDLGFGKRII